MRQDQCEDFEGSQQIVSSVFTRVRVQLERLVNGDQRQRVVNPLSIDSPSRQNISSRLVDAHGTQSECNSGSVVIHQAGSSERRQHYPPCQTL